MSGSLWSHELQHSRLPCPSLSPWDCSGSGPLSQWCHPTSHPLSPTLLLLSVFPSSVFSNELVLCIGWPKCWSLSISPSNEYSQLISFRIDYFDLHAVQGTLKESSPALQFRSISSSALSLLYGPTLTAIHYYWKNHSFDYMDLCHQIWCLCYLICYLGLS